MKVILAALILAGASAQPQLQFAAFRSLDAAVAAPAPQCFPERQAACNRHFSLYPNINCEGICELCELCDAAKVSGIKKKVSTQIGLTGSS